MKSEGVSKEEGSATTQEVAKTGALTSTLRPRTCTPIPAAMRTLGGWSPFIPWELSGRFKLLELPPLPTCLRCCSAELLLLGLLDPVKALSTLLFFECWLSGVLLSSVLSMTSLAVLSRSAASSAMDIVRGGMPVSSFIWSCRTL